MKKNAFWLCCLTAVLSLMFFPAGQVLAQGASTESFQFNELDFDRQGTGLGPGASQFGTASPPPPQDNDGLTGLFSDQPAPPAETGASILNLPGEPSPVSVPAAQGEAKIELASPAPAPAAAARRPAARASGRSTKQSPRFANVQQKRFYYASEAWRNHPEVSPVDCNSYLANRPLYHVKCLGAVAKRNL
ncbi:MAG: hypothetical protein LBJ64_01390 [Deltaproteobacteria bacterium]|nr:hypothetical protein [Deltaproteobacteria bacterium]